MGHPAEVLSGGAEVVGGGFEAWGRISWVFVFVVAFPFPYLFFPLAFFAASHFRFPFCSCWPQRPVGGDDGVGVGGVDGRGGIADFETEEGVWGWGGW